MSKIKFTPKHFQAESDGFKDTMIKLFQGFQIAGNSFLKPAVNTVAPVIGMAVVAKTKNPLVAQALTNILKSVSVGRVLHLTDLHGNGLRLKVI